MTGGASGIGRATALRFASEGASVCIADISSDGLDAVLREIANTGGKAVGVKADVSVPAGARELIQKAVQEFGGVDVLVNNVGIGRFGTVETLSEADWDIQMRVNVTSYFLCSKYAVPVMKGRKGAAIVNVASGAGLIGTPNSVGYCASKGAVVLLTRAMALDHAREGIRVNAVAPGVVDTPFNDRILQTAPDPIAARKATEQAHPLGRLARPEEVAAAIMFLASEDASFITGTVLSVDGGYTAQ